jgi:hypothetical protein
MKTRVTPYTEALVPAVKALNARLKAAGSSWGFYDSASPGWLGGNSAVAERRYVLAVDGAGDVHGGLILKTQTWRVGDRELPLLTWQGPVSEGLIDKTHAGVATKFLMHLRDQQLPLFGWGGSDQLNPLLAAMGWAYYPTPLLMKFVRPSRVARLAPFLRTSAARRRVLDIAAATGLATMGGWLANIAMRLRADADGQNAVAVRESSVAGWADDVWEAAKGQYRAIAVRDAAAVQRVTAAWPGVEMHRVDRDGRTVGWVALLVTQMSGDKRFGDLKVGSIVDALSLAGEERATVAAGTRALEDRGVDVIAGNLTHHRWLDAFAADGFLRFNGRRALYIADDMADLLSNAGAVPPHDIHFMPIDGDGPLGL